MSCDNNRYHYFNRLAAQTEIQHALGLSEPNDVQFALERLYQLGQSVGMAKLSAKDAEGKRAADAELAVETEMTQRLFERMRAAGIKPPTHSADGLPKDAARFGYGQIERLLQSIEGKGRYPSTLDTARSLAAKVASGAYRRYGLQQSMVGQAGALSAVGYDAKGYYRCANCGRFASQTKGHVCPMTASRDDLQRMLVRRLGVPESAFEGYNLDALGNLLEQARETGTVQMVHALTGAVQQVTLDGLPQALMAGYIPTDWKGLAVPVITDDLRVVGVLNAHGLTQTADYINAAHAIAQYYGIAIPPDAPVMDAYQARRAALVQKPNTSGRVTLEGGQPYDLGHFIGTEFRKNDARGTFVEIGGRRYAVYARSHDPADKSSARGRTATDTPDIVIGRTLPAAIGILADGRVAEAEDHKIEVYDAQGRLLAVYDPSTNTAGDTRGSANASAEQMAAVLAHRILYPDNAFDYALIQDFLTFRAGTGSPIAAADSGYLAVRHMLEHGHTLQLGARLGLGRCPRCGRFIGQGAHICPAEQKKEAPPEIPAEAAIRASLDDDFFRPEPEPLAEPAAAQIVPQNVQVSLSLPESFAEDLRAVLTDILSARPEGSPVTATRDERLQDVMTQLASLMAAQQQTLQQLAQREGLDVEKLGEAIGRSVPVGGNGGGALNLEALGAAIGQAVAQSMPAPAPVVVTADGAVASRPRRCLRCGQTMGENHQCPPRRERQGLKRPDGLPPTGPEEVLADIEMPAPDLYLDSVPAEWGGQRAVPLPENIPDLDPEYEMGQQERTIFSMIAMQLRKKSKRPTNRAFGLYGPAGTGKNTIARMLAASLKCDDGKQGLPYYEVNITPDMDIAQAIGEVVLTTDEYGNTVSRVELGPIGKVAASGGVAAINEIVRSPKLATALQSIIEDGEISIPSPEGGTFKVPVHPSAIFVATWNPGYEGDADRPAQAFLSRITALPLDYPSKDEQKRRVRAYFDREGLAQPSEDVLDAAVNFWNELRLLTGATGKAAQVGAFSPTRTTPGPRELARFVEYGVNLGWEQALLTLEIICDQDSEYKQVQVNAVRDRFEAHFGDLAETPKGKKK